MILSANMEEQKKRLADTLRYSMKTLNTGTRQRFRTRSGIAEAADVYSSRKPDKGKKHHVLTIEARFAGVRKSFVKTCISASNASADTQARKGNLL